MSFLHVNKRAQAEARERPDLGREYRAIGISALAAVLPYRGEQKNEAYAPAEPAEGAERIVTLGDIDHLAL
jgi:hypothetical protein